MKGLDVKELRKRGKGKLFVLGFDLDRIVGIFSTAERAIRALEKRPNLHSHNWWIELRKLDRVETGLIFERILIKTQQECSKCEDTGVLESGSNDLKLKGKR